MPEKKYELTVCEWEGKLHCVYLNDRRIAGGKPWGGGQNVARWLVTADDIAKAIPGFSAVIEALEMVRDADEDCKRDGLKTMPPMARAKIDAALKLARAET